MTEWNNILMGSINRISRELTDLQYINQYAPCATDDIQEYNDKLVAFHRLYNDMFRFLNKYVNMGKLDYILTLLPRHVYWSITPLQLNYIIMFINNDSELELIKYLIELNLPHSHKLQDAYIYLLGQEKLNYINLKNEQSNFSDDK